jgi:hypothetical protein
MAPMLVANVLPDRLLTNNFLGNDDIAPGVVGDIN